MKNIIVISGTLDSRTIINELLKLNTSVTATVTTDYGADILKEYKKLEIVKGKMGLEEMECLIENTDATSVVDASHPYAKKVSTNAIKVCQKLGVPYVRYERESLKFKYDKIIYVDDYKEASIKGDKIQGNILLTVGSNNIEVFVNNTENFKDRLFARVLPDSSVISKCEVLELTAQNIFAVKGPFSLEMNMEMIKHCNAKVVVTKDSGEVGGTLEKVKAAQKLEIPVIMIKRPEIEYINKVSEVFEVVDFIKNLSELV
ncbi:cobalt-precorrin-6A reductase [Herbivorax sp. ANBcel31]|uniref:cobalt-precorrin-6A reductase n=1 Tax=Herbivorax sp. ANBcel31 TaxID=3069754 RepID=UPI0027AF5372|nr:cobalt-precorrin-6A reductase [Herbivorax sp. ANBcel31]MDQ2086952.1 cobalt-precorrin-6A reductase [Herbivorax sp. ANBcel31]